MIPTKQLCHSLEEAGLSRGEARDKKLTQCPPPYQLHPWHQQREIVQYCRDNNIIVQAYCPIARNQKADDPTLGDIAGRHHRNPNQVLIRWSLQKGWVSLPKSDDPGRIRQNGDVFGGFELSAEDMELLDGLDQGAEGCLVQTVDHE